MEKKFTSIRAKFLRVYLLLLFFAMTLLSGIVLNFIKAYFISNQERNLRQTREVIDSVLTESDFRTESANSTLTTAADAIGITIWICTEPRNGEIKMYCYGENAAEQEERFLNGVSDRSLHLLQNIMDGIELEPTRNAFPEIFDKETLTVGYQQPYVERTAILGLSVESMRTGAVVLNISMDSIQATSRVVFSLMVLVMLMVAAIATVMIILLSNSIIHPVNQMKNVAKAIADGDFTQEITVQNNDEIGELAHSINTMTRELKELENMRSSFIANISHDFRSPLTSIKGFLEAMLDGTIPPEMHAKYMGVVLDETNRLTKMTNNILDLTKMENGQDELTMVNFDLNEMIVKIVIGFERRIEDKKIRMDFAFAQEKIYVTADLDRIQRVVYNLIDNALKFTDSGDQIRIAASIYGRKALIEVSDTGAGIDEKFLPHIFERFNKGDQSRGADKQGNGLGLAIVKQILLNHGEDITVRSKVGEGTCFTFTLPLAYRINLVEKK